LLHSQFFVDEIQFILQHSECSGETSLCSIFCGMRAAAFLESEERDCECADLELQWILNEGGRHATIVSFLTYNSQQAGNRRENRHFNDVKRKEDQIHEMECQME
jgi:hypothetical protein